MPTGLGPIEPGWLWLVVGLLLAIAEILAPGVFLIWFGGAALVTGLATLALGLGLGAQLALFAVSAIAAVYAGRRFLLANPIATSDPLLNDRVARLIGQQVVVTDAIVDGHGRVRVGDSVWPATGPDAAPGTRMHVVAADGATLVVARGG